MRGESVTPSEVAGRKPEEGHCIGLDDVRRSAAGVPTPLTDPQLDGRDRRDSDLDAAAGIPRPEERTGDPGGAAEVGPIEGRGVGGQASAHVPQIRKVGW